MCGRFYLDPEGPFETYIDEANSRLISWGVDEHIATGEVLPAGILPVVARSRKLTPSTFPMRWGYEMRGKSNLLINARSETAAEKQMFQESFFRRRCLIPMDYYFEWERIGSRVSQKYAIKPMSDHKNYLAGLYRLDSGSRIPQCVILTKEPSANVRFIHNRMPVIISEENKAAWLEQNTDPVAVLSLAEQVMTFNEAS